MLPKGKDRVPAQGADVAEAWDAQAVRRLGRELSNWGRWGADDQRGTLNFITPDRVLAACNLPRRGLVISCALPFVISKKV